jgi:uncharacterized protein (DUF849 family)
MTKRIITCAITGASFTPTMSPYLPYTPQDIITQAIDAHNAGAAILHLHARDPKTGEPSADPELFREYLVEIKKQTNAVVSLTSGGATGQSIDQRLNVIKTLQPELCTCNMGTINYGGFPMIDKFKGKWQFDWEEPFLEMTRREAFTSNFADIEYMLTTMHQETGTRFEFEAYDIGHLYTLAYYLEMSYIKPPIFLQFVMGTMGGIGAEVMDNIVFMKRTADRLLGNAVQWSVLGSGRYQMNTVTAGALMGSHVRVGLEDSLYLGKGQMAENSAQQVSKIRRIMEDLSLEVASPDETRVILDLKGMDKVLF